MNNKDKNHINIDQILDLHYQVLFNLATFSLDVANICIFRCLVLSLQLNYIHITRKLLQDENEIA